MARPDMSSPPCAEHSRRVAGAKLPSSTATITASSRLSSRTAGALSVCMSTFSTNTVTTSLATETRSACDQPVSHCAIKSREAPRLEMARGSSARIRRRATDCSLRIASKAASTDAYTGTCRDTPLDVIASRPAAFVHANDIGEAGHCWICHRALLKTVSADWVGAARVLRSTMTPAGSSIAASMMAPRRDRYVLLSSTPCARRTLTPPRRAARTVNPTESFLDTVSTSLAIRLVGYPAAFRVTLFAGGPCDRSAIRRILATVNHLQRYVAEEIATDHVHGLLSRREAMRRLVLLGLSTAAASALIAACGAGGKKESGSTTGSAAVTSSPPGMDHALPTSPTTWAGPNGELQGAWAPASTVRGGVLVIHENRGLNDWVRSVAGRFAGAGYSALAIDLLSEDGGSGKFSEDDAQVKLGKLGAEEPQRLIGDLKSGVDELQRRVPGAKVAVVGFCFGGGLVWQLLTSPGEPQLSAAVPFYGPLPPNPDFSGSKAAVLAIYGAKDDRVTKYKDAAMAALQQAGLVHDEYTAPDAGHAFFNDTRPSYNAAGAAEAWKRVLDWFGRYVG